MSPLLYRLSYSGNYLSSGNLSDFGPSFARKSHDRVDRNWNRPETSREYYALPKRGDKQFLPSLKTGDLKPAERRLADLRA